MSNVSSLYGGIALWRHNNGLTSTWSGWGGCKKWPLSPLGQSGGANKIYPPPTRIGVGGAAWCPVRVRVRDLGLGLGTCVRVNSLRVRARDARG